MVHEIERHGRTFTVTIEKDADAGNPQKEFDQLGTGIHWDTMNCLQPDGSRRPAFSDEDDFLRWAKKNAVYVECSLGDNTGYWYCELETVRKKYGKKWTRAKVEKVLQGTAAEYDAWVNGEVYYYITENEEGENIDSCGGFYGEDCLSQDGYMFTEHILPEIDAYCSDPANRRFSFCQNTEITGGMHDLRGYSILANVQINEIPEQMRETAEKMEIGQTYRRQNAIITRTK